MLKNLVNIQRLCTKLQVRYGEHDALILDLKREIGSREEIECIQGKWSIPYYAFIKADTAEGYYSLINSTNPSAPRLVQSKTP